LNRRILNKVADKCYLPANKILLNLIRQLNGKFKVSFSISGMALEQFQIFRPEVITSFQELAQTGCVEFLAETYAHSLASVFSTNEFCRQVEKHRKMIKELFGQEPIVFRNTELIYNNEIAETVYRIGFKGMLCEGVDRILKDRSSNFVYTDNQGQLSLLLKNYRLSDDVAFRFSDRNWQEFPLTIEKYISWLKSAGEKSEVINLFMDYETFGEHQWDSSGIFNFLDNFPKQLLDTGNFQFSFPSEVIRYHEPIDRYDVPDTISWADAERDLTAWLGNSIQKEALEKLYQIEELVENANSPELFSLFEHLQTSDHFYYMCTKFWQDGDVHKYFSPYTSPYEAYLNFMNVFSDLEIKLAELDRSSRMLSF
jgi:alpha-amylase